MLKVSQLSCERDDRMLFEQLDFDLQPGEIVQLAGANGSGKTTLLRVLAGLSSRYEGQLSWQGENLHKATAREVFRQNTLFYAHQPAVKTRLTPLENLQFLCPAHSVEAYQQALSEVGLAGYDDVLCAQLSAGQLRRVSLARLYLSHHVLWLLDEPFTALDHHGVSQFESLLQQRAEAGGAIVLTTHHQLALSVPFKKVAL